MNWLRGRITGGVLLGAVGLAGLMGLALVGVIFLLPAPTGSPSAAQVTVIPAPPPTSTPSGPTATPTAGPGQIEGGIGVGMFVQISGTGGDGLRLRSGPGTDQSPIFLGMEAEVFKVMDGPKSAGGMTWWYLEAPYDAKRAGWAAASYLKVVAAQNP